MVAVVRTGGKQYTVALNDLILVEKLEGAAGDQVMLNEVLAIDAVIGAPLLEGASVTAEIVRQTRNDTVIIFKKKRRHNYRRRNGHRQKLTQLRIIDIKAA
jgi:large subunit ribosomal protein L21